MNRETLYIWNIYSLSVSSVTHLSIFHKPFYDENVKFYMKYNDILVSDNQKDL